MKLFLTTNRTSLDQLGFVKQLQVAIVSAQRHTSLEVCLLYDGDDHPRLDWIRKMGVAIVPHRLSFADEVREFVQREGDLKNVPDLADIRCGSFLKLEIPVAVRNAGMSDQFVFYTDCDVIFLKHVDLSRFRPKVLAAHGHWEGGRTRWHLGGWRHFNGGVLVLNVDVMRADAIKMRQFVVGNGCGALRPGSRFMQRNLFLSDQVTLNLFYRNQIELLPAEYNWHPTMGVSERAAIVHFNGLKWTEWSDFCGKKLVPLRMEQYTKLVGSQGAAYEHYTRVAQQMLDASEVSGDRCRV